MELFQAVAFIVGICTTFYVVGGQGNAQCQGITTGSDFVIIFPGNYEGDMDTFELSLVVFSLSENKTSVTLSSEFDSLQSVFEIEPMGFYWLSVSSEFALSMTSERSNKVIQIAADGEIAVYGLKYQRFTSSAILGIPTESLDDNYVQMGEAEESILSRSLIAIVGVDNNTQVYVNHSSSVTFDGVTYPAGTEIDFSVEKNEVVQIVSNSDEESVEGEDVGLTLFSDKPVVVFSGYLCSSLHGSLCDNVLQEDFAATSEGTNYVYDRSDSSDENSVTAIQAYSRDTIVNVPGFEPETLQPGDILESDGTGAISTNQPVSVVQIVIDQDGTDPPTLKIIPGCSLQSCSGLDCPRGYLLESWLIGLIVACCSITLIAVSLVLRAVIKQKSQTSSYDLGSE